MDRGPSVEDAASTVARDREELPEVRLLHAAVHREHRHPQRVTLADPEDQIAAVLHDAIEDTDLELADLTEAGYSAEIVAAVDSLTHRAMESYEDYIDRVAANEIARPVKVADLRENLANNLRQPDSPGNADRIARYERALTQLEGSS